MKFLPFLFLGLASVSACEIGAESTDTVFTTDDGSKLTWPETRKTQAGDDHFQFDEDPAKALRRLGRLLEVVASSAEVGTWTVTVQDTLERKVTFDNKVLPGNISPVTEIATELAVKELRQLAPQSAPSEFASVDRFRDEIKVTYSYGGWDAEVWSVRPFSGGIAVQYFNRADSSKQATWREYYFKTTGKTMTVEELMAAVSK